MWIVRTCNYVRGNKHFIRNINYILHVTNWEEAVGKLFCHIFEPCLEHPKLVTDRNRVLN